MKQRPLASFGYLRLRGVDIASVDLRLAIAAGEVTTPQQATATALKHWAEVEKFALLNMARIRRGEKPLKYLNIGPSYRSDL